MNLVRPVREAQDARRQIHLSEREVVAHPRATPHLDGPVDHTVVSRGYEHLDRRDGGARVGVIVRDFLGGGRDASILRFKTAQEERVLELFKDILRRR